MEIKDILSVGLTPEDFKTILEGLDAIPGKNIGEELMHVMINAVTAGSRQNIEDLKRTTINRFREMDRKAKEQSDDLTVLKGKLILLKRLLMSNEAVKTANDIINSTPPITHMIDYQLVA